MFKWGMVVIISLMSSNCAYVRGITCGGIDDEMEKTKCEAKYGDRNAQYTLGKIAYDEGRIDEAIELLKDASRADPPQTSIYQPPLPGQKYGTVISVPNHNRYMGNPQAKALLSKIYKEKAMMKIKNKSNE